MNLKGFCTCFFILIISLATLPAGFSQENHKRPTVGLVLSGGGAKGLAHIGVLKILEEVGMPIDYIGGTSMGSIVGGLYATGYSADSLLQVIKGTDWDYMLSDAVSRQEMSIMEKSDNDRFLLTFPFKKNSIDLPEGVIKGQHIENKFAELCTPVYDIQDFNKLPIPFLCIAADIENGEEVVLTRGNLAEALRASMSIPSAFEPKIFQGKKLVDGGVINNFPLQQVKDMGADILIGVDVGYGSQGKRKSNNIFSIMEDVIFLHSNQVKEENLSLADILIEPDLHGLGVSSFKSGDSLVYYGEVAARSMISRLKSLADSINHLRRVQARANNIHAHDSLFITSIRYEGLHRSSDKILKKSLPFNVLHWVKASDIAKAAERFYATNFFNKVTYQLFPELNGTRLVFYFSEKSNGQMHFGFYYDNDLKASLYSNITFYNQLIKDTKFSLTLGLGRSPEIDLLYYLNEGPVPVPGVQLNSNWVETFLYDDQRDKTASFTYHISNARFFLQSNFGSAVFLRGGGDLTHTVISPRIIEGERIRTQYFFYGLFGQLLFDTWDHPTFPTKGQRLQIKVNYTSNQYLKPFAQLNLRYNFTIPASRRLILVPGIYSGLSYGDSIPFQFNYYTGGLTETIKFNNFPFIGYKFMESGPGITNFFYGRVDVRYEIINDLYITLMGNIGYQHNSLTDLFQKTNLISGYGLSLGIKTPVGPLEAMLMTSGESFRIMGYLRLGYWF